jgi:hypothetical protein
MLQKSQQHIVNIYPPPTRTQTHQAQRCLKDYGGKINTPELMQCYADSTVDVLFVQNDASTTRANPIWLPW